MKKHRKTILVVVILIIALLALLVMLRACQHNDAEQETQSSSTLESSSNISVSTSSQKANKDVQKAKEQKERAETEKKKAEEDKKNLESKLKNATTAEEKKELENKIKEVDNNIKSFDSQIQKATIQIKESSSYVAQGSGKSANNGGKTTSNVKTNNPQSNKPESKPADNQTSKPSNPTPEPEKPKPVTVVSTNTESKSENKDYVNYGYNKVANSKQAKGTSGISKEGRRGYTVYKYTRTVTKYSDGTVKYSNWSVASKSVVAPVNGVKWYGTYEEPAKVGYFDSKGEHEMGVAINNARRKAGLNEVRVTYKNWVAKELETSFGHCGTIGECIGYNDGVNGEGTVQAWLMDAHRDSILSKNATSISVGCWVGTDGYVYYAYSILG